MKVVKTIKEMKEIVRGWKQKGLSVGFVPTMGYLHEGHQSLIKLARENDKIVVSIFVNPIQFGLGEDLEDYPRNFERDCQICRENEVDLIFYPELSEMYDRDFSTFVEVEGLTEELCGLSRPGHFRGVCTVVNKLFHIVNPDRAYLGQKDAQQLAVIKRMVRDLAMDVEVIGAPIIREEDGLAMSSRNKYLSIEERSAALILSKTLKLAEDLVKNGEKDADVIVSAMKNNIERSPLARIDYVKIVTADSMKVVKYIDQAVLIAVAVMIGETRLIDNFIYDTRKF